MSKMVPKGNHILARETKQIISNFKDDDKGYYVTW